MGSARVGTLVSATAGCDRPSNHSQAGRQCGTARDCHFGRSSTPSLARTPTESAGPRGRHRSTPELAALADRIGRTSGSQLVIGDLNRTDGSPFFHDFLQISGLRDSRLGFGRQASWPVWSPYRISIDHAFATSDLAIIDRRLGPDIGSDHFPLIIDVAPAARVISSTSARTSGSKSSP